MKDYSVFTKEYVNSICQEVNRSFPNYTTMREKSFIAENTWDEARIFTTNIKLDNGVKSPIIKGKNSSEIQIDTDCLKIIVND